MRRRWWCHWDVGQSLLGRRWALASRQTVGWTASGIDHRRRTFVDAPITDEGVVSGMAVPNAPPPLPTPPVPMGDPSGDDAADVASSYAYPLDVSSASFRLYGDGNVLPNGEANRVFSSGKLHSYDPSVLYNDLRLQDVYQEQAPLSTTAGGQSSSSGGGSGSGASPGGHSTENSEAAMRLAGDEENDAVMRSGRNKQGAAGAAAMAAAMLDSRRAADGIALVPGHPLPVVFPRPDGLPPPLRFIKKFGPGAARQTKLAKRVRQAKTDYAEDADDAMYGEVMESEGRVESHSIHHSVAWRVQVLDEHRRPVPVQQFQHFREAADTLPERVMRGLANSGFSRPTLLQAAAIPQLMLGRDVVGVSPDGSGTTVAYAVPSIAVLVKVKAAAAATAAQPLGSVKAEHSGGPEAELGAAAAATAPVVARPVVVVVCPTRETTQRTAAMYGSLAGEDIRVATLYSSPAPREEEKQRAALTEGSCDVLVAMAACLVRRMEEGVVDLSGTHVLAIDKTNQILETLPASGTASGVEQEEEEATGYRHLETILQAVKGNTVPHQFSLWCGYMTPEIEALVRLRFSPLSVTVLVTREESTSANVRQILYALPSREERLRAIEKLYEQRDILKRHQVVVYCAYRETAEEVARDLIQVLSAPSSMVRFVHSGLRPRRREEVLEAFRTGQLRILVGTDVATRRLDVPDLEHVINYDLPATTEMYMQRIGQVGRTARQGTAHTLLTAGDSRVPLIARFVERQTGHPLSDDITKMIAEVEASGGEDSWHTPLLRLRNHAASNTKWRVRGKRESQLHLDQLSGLVSENDKRPLGVDGA